MADTDKAKETPTRPRKHYKRYIGEVLAVVIAILAITAAYFHWRYPTVAPQAAAIESVQAIGHPHAIMTKETLGFMPYWNLDLIPYIHLNLISDVDYFALTATDSGQIVKVTNGQTEPGWRWFNGDQIQQLIAQTQIAGAKFFITVSMQENDTIEHFLDNGQAQVTLTNNLVRLVKENNLNGLNVDFEFDGDPGQTYQQEFTQFAKTLTSTFRAQSPNTELSIDVYPLSIEQPRLFDIASLAPLFDKVIVMSYDYYDQNSDVAGPVSPMSGYKQGKYIFDNDTAYAEFSQIVPKNKLIMGVPYYGYDYPVANPTQPMSTVIPNEDIDILSYGRMRTDTDLKTDNCNWDELAEEEWCYYIDPQTQTPHQVWFENNEAIEDRYNFAITQGLGGVAIWTLGYDKNYPDLWNMIASKFTQTPSK